MKITLKNLTKRFPGKNRSANKEVIAVNQFDLEIPDGKLVGLLGPSGCGKSTALHLISGLLTPTSGRVFFDEEDVTQLPPEHRGVGLVFQNYALYPHLTVRQNIIFPLENLKKGQKLTKAQMNEKALEVAKLVQIEELLERKPGELSGGQQQRVAIARALVKNPRVLLLDEPLSNLDARLRLKTREEIRRIQLETKVTTIFVTHDQEEAMSISDYLVVMKDGVIQQIGKPQEVYDHPSNLFVAKFLGNPPINVFHGMVKNQTLFLDEWELMPYAHEDGEVYVAIRPEGFFPDEQGSFHCELLQREVMGRDMSVVCRHTAAMERTIRMIINPDEFVMKDQRELRFRVNPRKLFVFEKEEFCDGTK